MTEKNSMEVLMERLFTETMLAADEAKSHKDAVAILHETAAVFAIYNNKKSDG